MKTNLSASIITYNEEDNIKACLDSITEIVDEIIVLDSFSTDDTEKICRENPKVKFYQNPFDGHIQQKNRALDLCSSEWILSLDADERVSPGLKKSIIDFMSSNPDPEIAGVKFPRLAYFMHKYIRHSGWYPNQRYRLVRKGKAYWDGENPHDRIILQGRGKVIKGDLIHYTAKDLSDQVTTVNNFSSIAALMRYNKGKKFRFWRLIFKPISNFIEVYIYRLGILDGIQGLTIAVSYSYTSFLKEAKQYELDILGSDKPSNLSDLYEKKR